MNGVEYAAAGGAALIVLALTLVWVRSSASRSSITLRLSFSRGLDRRAIEDLLGSLQGLRPPWWRRWLDSPSVRFEVHAGSDGIEHRIVVGERYRGRVEAALRSHVPTVRFVELEDASASAVTAAVEYRLTSGYRQLRVGDESVSRALLGSLSPLHQGQSVVVQWIVSPSAPPIVPQRAQQPTGWQAVLLGRSGAMPTDADLAAAKEKLKHPVFGGVLRIGVTGPTVDSQRGLLRHVESALHATAAPGVHIRRRLLPKSWVARRLQSGAVPGSDWPMPVNSYELAALLGWPFGSVSSPALSLSGCRPLALSPAVPITGTIVGDGFARGSARAAGLSLEARVRHGVMTGSTGTGKTTLMTSMAVADIEAGHGVLLIDPKGTDLVDGVLERLHERHHHRVLVLDPADAGRPVGLNPLRPVGVDPELAAEQVVGIAHRLWSQTWGVRSQDLIYAALRTLVADPNATLVDVLPLLTDPAFRRPLVAKTDDVVLTAFWREYGSLSDSEAAQWVAPVANKFRQLIGRPGLRRILGQPHPEIDIGEHLDRGGVVLVPLNSGLIGEDAAGLFGALLLGQVWNLIQRRASQPAAARHPLMLHLDEFARYAKLSIPFEELLSQARSYRVGVTLACQHLHQIDGELRHAILANPRTRITFQVGAGDARALATEFGQGLTADDLTGLDAFQVVAQLYAAGRTQPAATLTTRPPEPAIADAAVLRQQSREKWGADGAAVEESIRERIMNPSGPVSADPERPTGRKRRAS